MIILPKINFDKISLRRLRSPPLEKRFRQSFHQLQTKWRPNFNLNEFLQEVSMRSQQYHWGYPAAYNNVGPLMSVPPYSGRVTHKKARPDIEKQEKLNL
jgi:hypothetical protein